MKFNSFYQKYKEVLFGYLMRTTGDYYLSGDITQESFTKYLNRYGSRAMSAPLLFKIARNALLDHQRKAKRSIGLRDENELATADPEHYMMIRSDYRRVLAALQQLGESERDTLSLVASSDMTYREIAEITNTSEQNVKVKVHRARVKLRKIMEEIPEA